MFIESKNIINNTALTDIKGRAGEDTHALVFVSPQLLKCEKQELQEMYTGAVNYLNAQIPSDDDSGSCVLMSSAILEEKLEEEKRYKVRAHTANLGDSISLLIVIDEDGKIQRQKCRMLNALHDGYNKAEKERAEVEQGQIYKTRLKRVDCERTLAVFRSIGDKGYRGLSFQPEIFQTEVEITDREQALLLTACDGLFETVIKEMDSSTEKGRSKIMGCVLDFIEKGEIKFSIGKRRGHKYFLIKKLGQFITAEDFLSDDLQNVSKKLANMARESGSTDDLTIIIHRVTTNNPVLSCVFDGHGGRKASDIASLTLPEYLIQNHNGLFLAPLDEILLEMQAYTHVQEHRKKFPFCSFFRKTNNTAAAKAVVRFIEGENEITLQEIKQYKKELTSGPLKKIYNALLDSGKYDDLPDFRSNECYFIKA